MNILVNCTGFIGDILFASSLAKKLWAKYPGSVIFYRIPLPQPKLLLQQNPYIDHVMGPGDTDPITHYDFTVNIPTVDQRFPATIQMQASAGIEDQSLEFDVWTVPEFDELAKSHVQRIKEEVPEIRKDMPNIKVVAYQVDWSWRAYQCTPQTLVDGIGAPHRDMEKIVHYLSTFFYMKPLGFDRHIPSSHPDAQDPARFAKTASVIKACDWFIGAEGGLSNLAAAVGTKCIITTDFIYQNYGPNGRVRKCDPPMMGPAVYYPNAGHVHLDPCTTDENIAHTIKDIIG